MGGFPSRENKLWVEYLRCPKAARVARAERVRRERQESQVSARWHRDAQTGGVGPVLMGVQVTSSYEQASDVILSRLVDSYPSCCVERGFCRAGVETGHTGGRCLSGPPNT